MCCSSVVFIFWANFGTVLSIFFFTENGRYLISFCFGFSRLAWFSIEKSRRQLPVEELDLIVYSLSNMEQNEPRMHQKGTLMCSCSMFKDHCTYPLRKCESVVHLAKRLHSERIINTAVLNYKGS